jgi:outer membrane translocation and assembly module TamA
MAKMGLGLFSMKKQGEKEKEEDYKVLYETSQEALKAQEYKCTKELEQHKIEIEKLNNKHANEELQFRMTLDNGSKIMAHEISLAEDKLRDTFKAELIKLSEAKAVAEAKYAEISSHQIDLESQNRNLQNQINKMMNDITEIAKANNDTKVVEPKIISPAITVLSAGSQQTIGNK